MNFEKYDIYNNEDYKKLLMEKYSLDKEVSVYVYRFIGLNGKIEDTKKYTSEELNKLNYRETTELERYKKTVEIDTVKEEELRIKNEEIAAIYLSFRENVKNVFLEDFAKENNISIEKSKGLLRYSIILINSTMFMIESSDIDFDSFSFDEMNYDKFMNSNTHLYSNDFKKYCDVMENTLNLFNVMAGE